MTWRPDWFSMTEYDAVEGAMRLVAKSVEWTLMPRTAFDALVAIAKAVDEHGEDDPTEAALSALDAAHPTWREWLA